MRWLQVWKGEEGATHADAGSNTKRMSEYNIDRVSDRLVSTESSNTNAESSNIGRRSLTLLFLIMRREREDQL